MVVPTLYVCAVRTDCPQAGLRHSGLLRLSSNAVFRWSMIVYDIQDRRASHSRTSDLLMQMTLLRTSQAATTWALIILIGDALFRKPIALLGVEPCVWFVT